MNGKQTLDERLREHGALFGVLQMHPNPLLIGMAEQSGYDFLCLDGEHGDFNAADFERHLAVLATTRMLAMVRLAATDATALRRYLNLGAEAVIVPHVSTAQEAGLLASAMPARRKAALVVILESALGAQNAEKILEVDGIDAALVGPNDLSADLGCRADYADPRYPEALSSIERASIATGKTLGSIPHAGYPLEVLLARGHRLFVLGTDKSLMREAMSAQITQARSRLQQWKHIDDQ